MPDLHASGAFRLLLIAADRRMSADLKDLLAKELSQAEVIEIGQYPDPREAGRLAGTPGVRLCILDVISNQTAAFAVLSAMAAHTPSVPVVSLLGRDDPDLILQCLRKGAIEFLTPPFTTDQMQPMLAKLSRIGPARISEEPRSNVFCVMPGKGACGSSTLACNLSYALKRQGAERVLLADLDGLTGTLPFLLKLKSNYSFVDALSHSAALDADLWRALVVPCHGVDVLLSPEDPVDSIGEVFDPGPLLAYGRENYDYVVIDTGSAYGEWNIELARICDQVVLVTTNELVALHATQRAIISLETNGIDHVRIRLVLNRYQRSVGLSCQAIATALETTVFETLPADNESIQSALLEGRPAGASSQFGKTVGQLARRLTGTAPAVNGSGGWLALFRRLATGAG